ncbi:hypothetical protein SAMN05421538_105206 [Paracoccus isoporae]|uniref:Uncharacterized protein n=1 Tax=Paracoccus isoporae TaxID=591205 RepID=A0A1G7BTX4_9RHOB|nr:hypothetical protein [Paracoccus isoporae]SDE30558.1 hypothetical protein SAMN05421538_105206 [Paracoccus isoporae]
MTSSKDNDIRNPQSLPSQPPKNDLPSVMDQHLPTQPLGQAAFWAPRHVAASPVLGQVPFLFWLSEVTSARQIVQLGMDDGIAYMALCQAAERLNGNSLCLALDSGEVTLSSGMNYQHITQYTDFSEIVADVDDISSLPEEVDLLVIGAPLERVGWDLLCDEILPKLSGSAVIAVINPKKVLADQVAKRALGEDDWPRLTLRPVVSDGAEVLVMLRGSDQPEQLRRLARQAPDQSSWRTMRQAFNRLGQGLVAIQQSRDLRREKKDMTGRLKENLAEIKSLKSEVKSADAAEKTQHDRQAEMAARLHDLQQVLEEIEASKSDLIAESETLRAQCEAARRDAEEATGALADAKSGADMAKAALEQARTELSEARKSHDERIGDIAALTGKFTAERDAAAAKLAQEHARCAELEVALEAERARRAELESLLSEQEQRLAHTSQVASDMTAHRDALLHSSSWKVTSPLRKATKLLRGR